MERHPRSATVRALSQGSFGSVRVVALLFAEEERMKLGKEQKTILCIGVAAVALLLAYPPWRSTFARPSMTQATTPIGHSFIFEPPAPAEAGPFFGVQIDTNRLFVEVLLMVVATLLVAFISYASGGLFRGFIHFFASVAPGKGFKFSNFLIALTVSIALLILLVMVIDSI